MSVLSIVALALSVAMLAAAGWLLWLYTAGNAWYASREGRAMVTLASSVAFVQLFSVVRRELGWPAWTADIEQALILTALILLCLVFLRVRREVHRVQTAAKRHRMESSP